MANPRSYLREPFVFLQATFYRKSAGLNFESIVSLKTTIMARLRAYLRGPIAFLRRDDSGSLGAHLRETTVLLQATVIAGLRAYLRESTYLREATVFFPFFALSASGSSSSRAYSSGYIYLFFPQVAAWVFLSFDYPNMLRSFKSARPFESASAFRSRALGYNYQSLRACRRGFSSGYDYRE